MNAKQKPDSPISSPSARLCALSALVHTLDRGKPLDSAWTHDRHFQGLNPSDRAFCQLLAKTVLRRLGQIDALLASLLERPLAPSASRIMHTLRLGTAQLLWLRTPPHAAVHSAVEMTRQLKMDKFSGLVNAVLKRVSQLPVPGEETGEDIQRNTPGWLWESWSKTYGADTAYRIALAHVQQDPPLDITVKSDAERWAQTLNGSLLPTGSVRLQEARQLLRLPGFDTGDWWVQDTAAALPARLLGDVQGKRVLDLCAAPGGKTAQLAAAGALVTAVEQSKERMALLKANLHRLRLNAECVTANALTWQPGFTPDAILLDAPCSATGTLRRHPDAAWRRTKEEIARLTEMQRWLLDHAITMLSSGNILVYAVCSLQPEEGEQQTKRLLGERNDIKLVPARAEALGLPPECVTASGEIRTLPCHMTEQGGMDGFYAVKFIKV